MYYFTLPPLHVSASSRSLSVLAELLANRIQWLVRLYMVRCCVSVTCRHSVHRCIVTRQHKNTTLSLTSTVDGGGWLTSHPNHCTLGNKSVPILYETGWAPGPVWVSAECLAHTGIPSQYRPAIRESLQLLRVRRMVDGVQTDRLKAAATSSVHARGNWVLDHTT
jgi:hypothetical protein